jgi:hypothetical protein
MFEIVTFSVYSAEKDSIDLCSRVYAWLNLFNHHGTTELTAYHDR